MEDKVQDVTGGSAEDASGVPFAVIEQDGRRYEILLPNADRDYIQKTLLNTRVPYEHAMLQDMRERLAPGELVLDVGANVGNHSLFLAAVAGARVIAFEPNRPLAAAIAASAVRNGLEGLVEVRALGLGREAASADFAEAIPENLGSQALKLGAGGIEVAALDALDIPGPVRMLKIDVEDMEIDVLRGAEALIRRDRPLLYIESRDEADFRSVYPWVEARNYTYWETFNATPTHLFLPGEQVTLEQRVEHLQAREVVQEYRLRLQLQRSWREREATGAKLADAEKRLAAAAREQERLEAARSGAEAGLREAETALARVERERDWLKAELAAARSKNAALGMQARRSAALEGEIEALRNSSSFRLGHALVRSAKLPAGLLRRWPARRAAAPAAAPGSQPPAEAQVAVVAAREDVAGAEVLLYGDIDLNVIDGSSVWLSSMASLLARHRRVILLAQRNVTTEVVVANIESRERVAILEPHHFGHRRDHFDLAEAVETIRRLDAACPSLRSVFVRGTDAASRLLADRQFHARTYAYLTDFYEIGPQGVRVPDERAGQLAVIATHARRILVQTERIAALIHEVTGEEVATLELPPPVADDLPLRAPRPARAPGGPIRIGYAGKIAPDWGVRELLDWAQALRAEGLSVELTIVGNKISGPKTAEERRAFREEMARRMGEVGIVRHEGLSRADALAKMREMDFVWCWRPGAFERATLELSTKLVEGVAAGLTCICYPNETNRRLLGADYPCFAEGLDDIRRLLRAPAPEVPAAAVAACREGHSFATLSARLDTALAGPVPRAAPRVCFAGHDFKFVDPFVSRLRLDGWPVTRDVWQWGAPEDEAVSRARLDAADVVFCEWGLANAVWYAGNLPAGKRLVVRIHLQEINARAQNLTRQIDAARVDRFVFVSARVRDEALPLFGWPAEKAVVIPNFVLEDEYRLQERDFAGPIRLGMVGIIPWRKRLDRAIDLLETLLAAGHAAELHIKGPRPEELRFMHAPGRREELALYEAQYERLQRSPALGRAVSFHHEGNDVAAFYRRVDHILSPSDFESFHYALADGVLSGCHPLVWPWEEAGAIYDPAWVVPSAEAAATRLLAFRAQPAADRLGELGRNRALVCDRYGTGRVYPALERILFRETIGT